MRDINQNGARSTDLQPIRTESVALSEPPMESGTERGAERTAPDMGRCIATSPARSVMLLFCFGGVFLRASFVTNTKAAPKLRFLDFKKKNKKIKKKHQRKLQALDEINNARCKIKIIMKRIICICFYPCGN